MWIDEIQDFLPGMTDEDLKNARITFHEGRCPACDAEEDDV